MKGDSANRVFDTLSANSGSGDTLKKLATANKIVTRFT